MDLNHRLIEAVRQCPLLYKNNVTLADRKCGWQQIAQQMKVQEAILKTRWHFLREHYKRTVLHEHPVDANTQFPYKKEMEFLLPYLRQPPPRTDAHKDGEVNSIHVSKPEFVITEQDLDNDSGNEEYVFLDVEALGPEYEVEQSGMRQISETELRQELELKQDEAEEHQIHTQEEEGKIEEGQNNDNKVEEDVSEDDDDVRKQKGNKDRGSKREKENVEEATCNKNGKKEDETVRTQIQEASSEEKIVSKVEIRESDSSSDYIDPDSTDHDHKNTPKRRANEGERCEDEIFGELVCAMLKKMPLDKKRSVKREIMNLLLT